MMDLGPLQNPAHAKMASQICKIKCVSKTALHFAAAEGFVRDLFIQGSLGTPVLHFGRIWAHIISILMDLGSKLI